jgi:hypothetical protein
MTDSRAVHHALQVIADDLRALPPNERFRLAAVFADGAADMAADIRWATVYELRIQGKTVIETADLLDAGRTTVQWMTDRYREANPKAPVPFVRMDMSTQDVIRPPLQRG